MAVANHDPFKTTMIDIRKLLAILVMAFAWPVVKVPLVLAQGTTVITSTTGVGGLGTTVTAHGHTVQITGGTRPGNGTNLFHSFDQFNVGSSDTAQFLNTTPSLSTSNILSRVTGGSPSAIFGTIDTMSYPGANLFLMNPAGIVFGSNAILNVGGSVAFTTADYLRLADANGSNAGIFHADPTAASLLTSASITAFGFLGTNPSAISVQGTEKSLLHVQPGQSISLVGGNQGFTYADPDTGTSASVPDGVTVIGGHIRAPDGQINIASIASPGEIRPGTLDHASNINGQSFGTLGTVQISQQSRIDTSGEGGGTILIRGGRLVVNDSTISANTKPAGSDTDPKAGSSGAGIDIQVAQDAVIDNGATLETNVGSGASHGSGGVRITADHITISGGQKALDFVKMNPYADIPFGIRSNVGPGSTAVKSGDISLNATSSIQIKDHGQIGTETASAGSAGHITLKASGPIEIDSSDVSSRVKEDSNGNSGNIKIVSHYGNISLTNSNVFTATDDGSTGTLGSILINAHDLQLHDASKIGGDSNSTQIQTPNGDIVIFLSGRLSLAGGSFINTGTFKSANSADLIIKSPTILITGKDRSGQFSSGLYTSTISSGNGGRLRLFTDNLKLADGGILSSNSFIGFEGKIPSGHGGVISIEGYKNPGSSITIDGPGSGILTSAAGTGAAGDIVVKGTSVTLQNGGTISAETTGISSKATGGSITVHATDQVTLTNGASITASSTGSADAGNISINAGQQLLVQNSKITTEAHQANGGNIKVVAIDRINLTNGRITTSVLEGSGDSGKIFIDPNEVVVQNNSTILSQAVHGRGGDITIMTPRFLQDTTSLVDASSQFGQSGKVTIQSSTSNLSGTVAQLASKTAQTQALLQNRCVALAGGEQSTFIVAGRDALPSEPGGWLSSPLSMNHLLRHDAEHATAPTAKNVGPSGPPAMVVPMRETQALSLRRLTPPGFLVRTFGIDGLTSCRS